MQKIMESVEQAVAAAKEMGVRKCRACKGSGSRSGIGSRMMARKTKSKRCTGCGGAGFVSAKHRLAMAAPSEAA